MASRVNWVGVLPALGVSPEAAVAGLAVSEKRCVRPQYDLTSDVEHGPGGPAGGKAHPAEARSGQASVAQNPWRRPNNRSRGNHPQELVHGTAASRSRARAWRSASFPVGIFFVFSLRLLPAAGCRNVLGSQSWFS